MSDVVMVDWLGRGGIAQCAEVWAMELDAAGHGVTIVTRPGRELGEGAVAVAEAPARRGRIASHRAVVRTAVERIRDERPDVVVVHNYVLPPLEAPVHDAARAVGARVVVVIHDHRLHTLRAGTRAGLRTQIRRADAVLTHTRYVADGVTSYSGRRDIEVVPHPAQTGMLRHVPVAPFLPNGPDRWVGHFGVLKRRYKGGDVVEGLARQGLTGWGFLAVGVGAPRDVPGLYAHPGYAPTGALLGAVAATDATLAPYDHATQSGVVVLAHLLGSVPVASAVGGIPEQIDDGVDGILVAPGASRATWRAALARLSDDDLRRRMAAAGTARAWRDHETFVAEIRGLAA